MGSWGTGKVEKLCKVCNKRFFARNDRPGYFCSRKCQVIGREKKEKIYLEYECKKCFIKFKRRKGFGGTNEFCSRSCSAKVNLVGSFKVMPSGVNHPKWKGGISDRPYTVRKIIRKLIKESGKCYECGDDKNLQGHHIIRYSEQPDLGIDENNIIILCCLCHSNKHPEIKEFILRGRNDDR